MTKRLKTRKLGTVQKVIQTPYEPEKAEIEVEGADHLYREIRIENVVEDEHGRKAKLKQGEKVDVIVEADPKATTRADGDKG